MNPITFIRKKYPYFIGFLIIESLLYYYNGPTGNFTTGFLGLFVIWSFYVWMYSGHPVKRNRAQDRAS